MPEILRRRLKKDEDANMFKFPITVVVAAKNEAENVEKCMDSLYPCERIIWADSGSDDGSEQIAKDLGAEVFSFHYEGGYPKKRQWILDTVEINTEWVMMVDADEEIPSALWNEIRERICIDRKINGYFIRKGFHFLGKKFRCGGFSHSAMVLWRTGKGHFEETLAIDGNQQDMEVHERVLIEGHTKCLKNHLIHRDFKGLGAYYDRHNKYATWEARLRYEFLKTGKWGESDIKATLFGNTQEVRRFVKKFVIMMPFEPLLWFCYHYIFRLGFLEGRRGLLASQIRSEYIRQVRAKAWELNLNVREKLK